MLISSQTGARTGREEQECQELVGVECGGKVRVIFISLYLHRRLC